MKNVARPARLTSDDTDRTWKILKFNHVSVVFVTQGLDSSQADAETMIGICGVFDPWIP
jgi:hypothetical protein